MAKSTYQVLDNLNHDNKPYKPGSSVELEPEQAAPLLAIGVIAEPEKESPKKGASKSAE